MNIENLGNVSVSSEVIAKIAGLAALEIEGVSGLKETIASGIAKLIGKEVASGGVVVSLENDQVNIEMNIIVKYGAPIPEVSFRVQQNVKNQVEKMTGKSVVSVNVNISDVQLPKD
ncbi:MAG: Asp23/Gls24 family envelope stress response protein [Candidatus Hydrogenedentota bacterium]